MGEEKGKKKIKLAFYWAATCGGCDVATLDIEEKILDVVSIADIVLWPVAMDFKYKDLEAMAPKSIDVCVWNGACRLSEHEELAKMLREKSKVLIAYGACAAFGGIPGLANVSNKEEIFKIVYQDTATTVNPNFVTPQEEVVTDGGDKLTLPEFWNTVKSLDQVVDVDYYVPGCPPQLDTNLAMVGALANFVATGELPPKGAIIGASEKCLCEECPRKREEGKMIERIYRPYELKEVDPEKCLLDQGLLCMGIATRGGCGAKCPSVNMSCRGCYGPSSQVRDHGAAFLSAIASVLGKKTETEMIGEGTAEEVKELLDQVKDPLGTFYRFSLPMSMLKRVQLKEKKG
jgi:F420-non-reducing hydrogenase small subunit